MFMVSQLSTKSLTSLLDLNKITYSDTNRYLIRAVNLHITKSCNYRCKFCFAHFNQLKIKTNEKEWKEILNLLAKSGTEKVTFVGGEPTLIDFLPELVIHAKNSGMTTMIITNGTKITPTYLRKMTKKLDWIGLSIDSGTELICKDLGRGTGNHVAQTLRVAKIIRKENIRLKVNTVVNQLNYSEDMTWLIKTLSPERWKVFQMLPITGENDTNSNLLITKDQFQQFIDTHKILLPVAESNDLMTDSYIMIDPEGRFFNNTQGRFTHGRKILDVGVEKAFHDTDFKLSKFERRKGIYEWK